MSPPLTASSTPSITPTDWRDWRWQHNHAARSLDDIEALFPQRFALADLRASLAGLDLEYSLRATPYYLDLARRARDDDPLWALAVPSPREARLTPDERHDPIGDELPQHRPVPAITRRYVDRALLYPTSLCSVHCRHCFRKRLVGRTDAMPQPGDLDRAIAWIESEHALREVILTGGDPLTLGDARLGELLERLDGIDHLRALRIHTRMPVVNPFRVTSTLAEIFASLRKPLTLVTHFNHAREVTPEARAAVTNLRRADVDVLNQSVLLAGINDGVENQRTLLWALSDARVRPYALHHADLVPGTSHLRTTIATGQHLMRELRGTLPGHLIPRYLLDVPGGHGKIPAEPAWLVEHEGEYTAEAPDGTLSPYPASPPPGDG